jgi:hypothetical protein
MATISVQLKPNEDGTLHVPVPAAWRDQIVQVKAELVQLRSASSRAIPGLWKDLPGPYWIAPDFDAPLDDFHDYME